MRWRTGLLYLCTLLCMSPQNSEPVSITQEPYHHLIRENPFVRVFAVEVPRLQSTLSTKYEHNYVTVYLGDSKVARSAAGSSFLTTTHYDGELRLFYGGKIATERNEDATASYRNITVELLKKGGDWTWNAESQKWGYPPFDQLGAPLGLSTTSMQSVDMGGMHAHRIQIMPGDNRSLEKHGPALLVTLSDLELNTDRKKARILPP